MSPTRFALLAFSIALAGCGGSEPRFAEVTISSVASTATLSGSTHGATPAIELSPGCPGYLDLAAPEHLVHLSDATAITVTARSNRGPLAIAIVGAGEVRCDSDTGSGHAPHVTLSAPGEYAVHVASLNEAIDLPYELQIAPAGATATSSASPSDEHVQVSVTITSEPSGATVRTPEGRSVGTTPAMFALSVAPGEIGQERRFVLEMPGRQGAEVSGRLIGGAVVLHAALQPALAVADAPPIGATSVVAPSGTELVVSAASAQPIRDYQVARQSLEVGGACTIQRASVDVDIRHSFIGDLRVVLRSPQGTSVTLHNHGGGGRANLVTSWDWDARRGMLHPLADQSAQGRWEMAVHDDAGADTGTFRSFTLHVQCREGNVASASASGSSSGTSSGAQIVPTVPAAPPDGGDVLDPWSRGGTTGGTTGGTGARRPRPRPRVDPQPPPLDPWQAQPPQPPQPPQPRRNPGVIQAPMG